MSRAWSIAAILLFFPAPPVAARVGAGAGLDPARVERRRATAP